MDNKILHSYSLWVVLLIVVGILLFFLKFNLPSSLTSRGDQSYLVLDFGENTVRRFEGEVVPNMTILEALYSASESGRFDLRYTMDKNGLQLARINGAINLEGSSSWHFYLNGTAVKTSEINSIKIETGDTIEANYQ